LIRLRAFEEADLVRAFQLDQICFPPGIAYSLQELKLFLARTNALAMVAEDTMTPAGPMVGFLIADRTRRSASVITIDVDPRARRLGVGGSLMHAAEAHYRQLGCTELKLEVAVDNIGAQDFYRARGFIVMGRIRGYYHRTLDALTLRKLL